MTRPLSDKQQKKLADDACLLKAWKKFHRDERAKVRTGPYGAVLGELFRMFANLKHVQPSQLIGYTRAIDWSEIDYPTRLIVIHETNAAITKLHEKHDDPQRVPDHPRNSHHRVSRIIAGKAGAPGALSRGKSRTVRL